MKIITETPRTFLREFLPSDASVLFALNDDPEVVRYTGNGPFNSEADAADFLANYRDYECHGMGRWMVVDKGSGESLGWCGLKYHPEKRLVEVGFRFFRMYWGMGYATETAHAAIHYGFSELKLRRIYAHVHIDNKASRRVIEKLGMTFVKYFDYDNLPAALFVKESPYYAIRQINPDEVIAVRHPVLRSGRPVETAVFKGDDLDSTFHLGGFFKERLVGVVTLMQQNRPGHEETGVYQLRGMAVLEAFRGCALGEGLLECAEAEVIKRQGRMIWMNAREKAVRFYERAGYHSVGKRFEIPGVGLHYFMEKSLF